MDAWVSELERQILLTDIADNLLSASVLPLRMSSDVVSPLRPRDNWPSMKQLVPRGDPCRGDDCLARCEFIARCDGARAPPHDSPRRNVLVRGVVRGQQLLAPHSSVALCDEGHEDYAARAHRPHVAAFASGIGSSSRAGSSRAAALGLQNAPSAAAKRAEREGASARARHDRLPDARHLEPLLPLDHAVPAGSKLGRGCRRALLALMRRLRRHARQRLDWRKVAGSGRIRPRPGGLPWRRGRACPTGRRCGHCGGSRRRVRERHAGLRALRRRCRRRRRRPPRKEGAPLVEAEKRARGEALFVGGRVVRKYHRSHVVTQLRQAFCHARRRLREHDPQRRRRRA